MPVLSFVCTLVSRKKSGQKWVLQADLGQLKQDQEEENCRKRCPNVRANVWDRLEYNGDAPTCNVSCSEVHVYDKTKKSFKAGFEVAVTSNNTKLFTYVETCKSDFFIQQDPVVQN